MFLPAAQSCSLSGQKVDKLASDLLAMKGAGHLNPYVYVGLRAHVPRWAMADAGKDVEGAPLACCGAAGLHQQLAGDNDQPLSNEIAKELARTINPGAAGDRKIPLTWNQWQLAYPRFALEAAVCGMVPYAASMSHMVR